MRKLRKKFAIGILVIVGIISAIGVGTASAQGSQTRSEYTVIQGTTLWNLACETGNCRSWQSIFRANVEAGLLKQTDSTYDAAHGWVRIHLPVGQRIILDPTMADRAEEFVEPTYVELENMAQPVVRSNSATESFFDKWILTDFPWLPLALILAILGWIGWKYLSNPATAGPAMREEGLNPSDAPNHFRERASRLHTDRGGSYISADEVRILSLRRGRGNGPMRVRYRDGREELKLLRNDVVYEAVVEYPSMKHETLYTLEACGNDIRFFGTRTVGEALFSFTADGPPLHRDPPVTTAQFNGHSATFNEDDITVTVGSQSFAFEADGVRRNPQGGLIISATGKQDVFIRNGRISGAPKFKRTAKSNSDEASAIDVTSATEGPSGLTKPAPMGPFGYSE